MGEGRIKALWVIHSNPAVTLPDADRVRGAVEGCDFVVVSDITERTDTARGADVLLPAAAWAEKSGTVTNSDRTVSRQRAVLAAPGIAQPDWWILAEVAKRMGFDGFDWTSPAEIFREYATLSGIAGSFGRDFDISDFKDISDADYDTLSPFRWPQSASKQGGRFFADGGFYHADGKAKMLALTPRDPASMPDEQRPFRLNTGRLRDQWHTMTRTALSPRLSAHLPEPFVDMHPKDADRLGLKPADLVRLTSPHGTSVLRLRRTTDVAPGDLFVPMHWTGETAPSARIDALVAPVTDPISGQPESKASTVAAEAFPAKWYGFAISATSFDPDCAYWARARTGQGWRAELAGDTIPDDWETYARSLLKQPQTSAQVLKDPKRGTFRIAFYQDEILIAALYIGPEPVDLMRDFLAGLPGTETLWALAGKARGDMPDPGPVVCSCFAVGRNTILREIEEKGLTTVEEIGACLSAGTNCGSCKSELAGLLASVEVSEPAE